MRQLRIWGIRTFRPTPRSPWQICYVERVIGSIRGECLNHEIVLSQAGQRVILAEYLTYVHTGRAHECISGEPPMPRTRRARGHTVSQLVLGGLHHVYDRTTYARSGSATPHLKRESAYRPNDRLIHHESPLAFRPLIGLAMAG